MSADVIGHERTSYEVNDVAQWQVGTDVSVRYDPMQPETSIWTPGR